jgi:uncharacterized membrane protein (DUF485 family)
MHYDNEMFLATLMRRQLRLSVGCAVSFLAVLFGLPMANYWFPELMATRVFGFTLTWLILGVGFFPAVWVIAWVFIRKSLALEAEEVRQAAAIASGEAAGAGKGTSAGLKG